MPRVKSNLGWIALAIALPTQTALAQGDALGADEIAEAIVTMTSRVWTGPRTPRPAPAKRPTGASVTLLSSHAPLAVHADLTVPEEALTRAMRAFEHAHEQLVLMGWPQPISDGGLGGGPEIDLYLTASLPSGAYSDGMVPWSYLDRASTFAVLGPLVTAARIEACVSASYVESLLLSADPAEAEAWRRATASWLTWELTGRFGCDDAVHDQQAEPFRSWIAGAAGGGSGGALWLAYLSARHDGASGHFVRDLWALASQRTWEGDGLRADPDLWSATESAVERSGDRLLDIVEDLAVERWFVGRGSHARPRLAFIESDARVPVTREMTRVPTRVASRTPLQAFGSAYVVMGARAWKDAVRLRTWLRGEYGVRWSLVAIQLDSRGDEVRRIAAPHTAATPHAYLPIELDPETASLLFVVTNLGSALPDADAPALDVRGFELVVDRTD